LDRRKLTQRCQIGQKKAYTEISDKSEASLPQISDRSEEGLQRDFRLGRIKLTQRFQIGQK
jgi:hypothetical protein